ncbi:exonuclease domain-containing protein [Arthrobacter gandavensis]|uniref:Exonuclease domain-containing protein n=1 Tax=Arthrobacter gandavensis TaxID=169960 RepID=A0ABN2PDS6_9MICC|nr:exonuclease domain-containing protein [Arthrobacter citreus]
MTLSFTAIDFETANRSRGSICSVGLAKVVDGRILETRSWIISPPDGGGFDAFNSALHGITAADTVDAPDWNSSLSEILDFIGDDTVLAHNAGFDIGALRDACDFAGLEWPVLNYTCTLVLARTMLDLPVYKLPWVTEALGIPPFDHHEAGADAQACALVAIALAESRGSNSVTDLLTAAGVRLGRVEGMSWLGSQKARPVSQRTPRAALVPGEINPDGPMAGEVVCFTGRISWSREDAQEMVVRNGGTCSMGKPTRKTTILVTGDYDESSLRPGMTFGNKLARAFELVEQGQKLEIMTEDDFRQKLDVQEGHRDLPVPTGA